MPKAFAIKWVLSSTTLTLSCVSDVSHALPFPLIMHIWHGNCSECCSDSQNVQKLSQDALVFTCQDWATMLPNPTQFVLG